MIDLAIIGGGPGGYVAADRAGAKGLNVVLFEKRELGGVCLNEGCIPPKTPLYSAKVYDYAKHGDKYGVSAPGATFDFGKIVERKNKVVKKLVGGVGSAMKANKVRVVRGEAKVKGRSQNGIEIECAGENATVSGQRRTLEQMVFNLADNALAYTRPNGSVPIETGTDSDGAPFVRVSDTGIGIAPADLKRVFERFYRVDKSHSKMTGGTGLGLSIVKHGAALHGAALTLDSTLNVGTRITLTFPKNRK